MIKIGSFRYQVLSSVTELQSHLCICVKKINEAIHEDNTIASFCASYLRSCRVVEPQATASDDNFVQYGVIEKVEPSTNIDAT